MSWPKEARFAGAWPALAVLGACLAWAIDNNLTRKVSLSDASFIAMAKGLVAGSTNLVLVLVTHAAWPDTGAIAGAALLGFASYGASLILFVIGLRHLGTARTGAYFSVAPFFGTDASSSVMIRSQKNSYSHPVPSPVVAIISIVPSAAYSPPENLGLTEFALHYGDAGIRYKVRLFL